MMRRNVTAALTMLIALGACGSPDQGQQQSRQAEIAQRGTSVMPFDLEQTTHRFLPLANGLRQEVVADRAGDTAQITLIRQHLAGEADRFRAGDFGDPASIHGRDMPGLAELSAGSANITIAYADLSDGAALDFHTTEPNLVQALHTWAQAQVSDHGSHAER